MFLNVTEETCTGTGDTLALTGATADFNAFGKTGNGEEGALYSCVVKDSGGVIRVAGIYTFNKAANTMTRNDTWNDNGTTVDKNPATNLTLGAGTHTITCDAVGERLLPNPVYNEQNDGSTGSGNLIFDPYTIRLSASATCVADELYATGFYVKDRLVVNATYGYQIVTAATIGSIGRCAIYKQAANGWVGELVCEGTGTFSTTATTYNWSVTLPVTTLEPGMYFVAILTDGDVVLTGKSSNSSVNPFMSNNGTVGSRAVALRYNITPGWSAMPVLDGVAPNHGNEYNKAPYFGLKRVV